MNARVAVLIVGAVCALCACGGGGSGGNAGPPAASAPPPPPPPPAPPTITGPAGAFSAATAGTDYSATITATGATPITFSVTAGSLPDGMTLDANTGVYSGRPLVLGNFSFTVRATNSVGIVNAPFTQVVNPAVPNANLLLTNNRLVSFNTTVPTAIEAPVSLSGILDDDELVAIARRPSNGFLYGLGVEPALGPIYGRGRLYALHPTTGVATPVGGLFSFWAQIDPSFPHEITGSRYGAHVSPGADVLRVVSNTGRNFRFDLNWGRGLDGFLSVEEVQMDSNINGASLYPEAVAYTDNNPTATTSTLYAIAPDIDSLCIQNPANSGTLANCVALSEPIDSVRGFDIAPGVNAPAQGAPVTRGAARAIVRLAGQTTDRLVAIDLVTGVIGSSQPAIGSGGILSLALQMPAGAPMYALSTDGVHILLFSAASPGTVKTITVTGISATEKLVAIDLQPSSGRLYGLAVNHSADTGSLYILDMPGGVVGNLLPGAVALVSDTGIERDLPAPSSGYGIDYDPLTDHIRVVAGNGLNFRIHGTYGHVIDGNPNFAGLQADADLAANVTPAEIAYTNSLDIGGNITTLYTMDAAQARLCVQMPAAGTLASCQSMTLGGAPAILLHQRGFDIPGNVRAPAANAPVTAGIGYVAGAVAPGVDTHLFEVDLVTGVFTDRGRIGDGTILIAGLAVGQSTVR